MYRAEVFFAPANELITSFFAYTCKKAHKRLELGPEFLQNVRDTLTPEFLAELDALEYWDCWGQLQLLVWKCPEQASTGDFLRWFAALSEGEIYEHLAPWIKHFPESLGVLRDRYVTLLTRWDEQYFSKIDPAIIDGLQKAATEHQALKAKLPTAQFVDQVTNGMCYEPIKGLEHLLLIPQYHSQPVSLQHFFEGLTLCLYTSQSTTTESSGEPSPQLYRMTRSLSDKNRLKILHFLKDGEKSYTDIVRHIGLAKSTTHEHLLNLRSSGLIRAHVVGSNTNSYSLRLKSVDLLRDQLLAYLK